MRLHILSTLVFLYFFLSPRVYGYSQAEIKSWCSQTPNPKPCEYFFGHNPNYGPIKQKPEFLKASMKLALDRALHVKLSSRGLGSKFRNKREKAAWADCLELYEYTIQAINKTIDLYTKRSQNDAQTWLCTALTNLETCKAGFAELGVTNHVFPLMNNNILYLISNTLAMNKGRYSSSYVPNKKNEFPTWISKGARKLLQFSIPSVNSVVAQDGSGDYNTIADAIAAAGKRLGIGRFVILVKAGTYNENIEISTKNIMLLGEGIGKTIITGSRSVDQGSTTFKSATLAVNGDGFIGLGFTVRNTAGPNSQAAALRSGSDLSVFYKCSFEGYQDTLYTHSQRQFYRECDIYGTVDFIFGNAAVVFQNCNIYPRNSPSKINVITAQGRSDPNQNTGISIHNCKVTAAPDLKPVQSSVKTYLGRPWQQYSRTVFIKTSLDSLIDPAGWIPWSGNFALSTLYYGEYLNTGAGASTSKRVIWSGYHVITNATEVAKFTVENFISGGSWLPASNVPFTSAL